MAKKVVHKTSKNRKKIMLEHRHHVLYVVLALPLIVLLFTAFASYPLRPINPQSIVNGQSLFWTYAAPQQAQVIYATNSDASCVVASTDAVLPRPLVATVQTVNGTNYYPIAIVHGPEPHTTSSLTGCRTTSTLMFYRGSLTETTLAIIRVICVVFAAVILSVLLQHKRLGKQQKHSVN